VTDTHLALVQPSQERRLGGTVLNTFRTTVDLYDVVPNPNQPRLSAKADPELQRQIEANEGLFEPLLLEPHPDIKDKYRIIDGERRWTNSKILIEEHKKEQYRKLPAEITDRTLSDEERYRVWIYIHRQRKEWDTKEKEMVAYRLVDLVGRASAANILGIKIRELDKFTEIYQLSEKIKLVRDPSASITWAREIKSINRNLLVPPVLNAIVEKINGKLITNSKDVRRLRVILKDPVAKDVFLQPQTTINDALEKIGVTKKVRKGGLAGDLGAIVDSIRKHPWTELANLRGDEDTLRTIDEAEKLLKDLKKSLRS
jgi:ParB family chromosome partitioning protein